jgi:hypothetical protein
MAMLCIIPDNAWQIVLDVLVSNTREACRSGAPGHQTGMGEQQIGSFGVMSSLGCFKNGDQCFQFLSKLVKCNVR